MPRCTVCKTTEGLELYKGQFRCPDHVGTQEEIEAKRKLVWENMGILGELTLMGRPEQGAKNSDVIRDQIADEWIKKQNEKRKKKEEASVYRVLTGKEVAREEINLRYGSPGTKE